MNVNLGFTRDIPHREKNKIFRCENLARCCRIATTSRISSSSFHSRRVWWVVMMQTFRDSLIRIRYTRYYVDDNGRRINIHAGNAHKCYRACCTVCSIYGATCIRDISVALGVQFTILNRHRRFTVLVSKRGSVLINRVNSLQFARIEKLIGPNIWFVRLIREH